MAVVIIDGRLIERRRRGQTVRVEFGLQDQPALGSAFYGRWVADLFPSRGEQRRCVHERLLGEACDACWVLDRAHYSSVMITYSADGERQVHLVEPMIVGTVHEWWVR